MLKASSLLKYAWLPLKSIIRHRPYPLPFLHYLRNRPTTQVSKLDNGLTVATEERDSYNVCVGLYFDGGSRYESSFENGIAHFFEHLAFKGTKARTKTKLEQQISSTGAKFSCFTTREMVAYYVECLAQDTPLVLDILTDCIFNNSLLESEIERQKKAVYMEMLDLDVNPVALLYDYLHQTAFSGTPLGETVMGPSSNLSNFNEGTITRYKQRNFSTSRTVLSAVGGVNHCNMVRLANTYMSKLNAVKCVYRDVYRYTGSEIRFRDDSMPQAHIAIAVEGPSYCDKDRVVMDVAASYLGGWDQTQTGSSYSCYRLANAAFEAILCDAYESFNITYKDTALWGIHFMASSIHLEDMLYNIQCEFMHLCCTISEPEVERAKRQLKLKILWETSRAAEACHQTGRSLLYNGKHTPVHQQMCVIDNVHAEDVRRVCTHYLYDRCPVISAIGPSEGLPEYNRIRTGMYWLRF